MTPQQILQQKEARRRLAAVLAQDESRLDLARAALLIAAEEEPGLTIEPYLSRIEELGHEARLLLDTLGGPPVGVFNEYFFETLGFSGNRQSYQDPRNSFLNRVLERRTGIPITLAVLYAEIGRRAGLIVEGIGMPGHFLVQARATDDPQAYLIDAFHACVMTSEDCQARLDDIFGGRVTLHPSHLQPVSKRQILARMLANLKAIYAQIQRPQRALAATERILLIMPDAHAEHRDAAFFLAALERWHEAAERAAKYLQLAPAAPDFTEIRELAKKWRSQQAHLN